MKSLRWSVIILAFSIGLPGLGLAEKFESLGSDTFSQSPSTIPVQPPTVETFPGPTASSTIKITETTPTATMDIPDTSPVTSAAPDISASIKLPDIAPVKKLKITVPTFEMKGIASGREEMIRRNKRKTLIKSIVDEITRYWLLIVLGIVALLVIYALRKGTGKPTTLGDVPDKPTVQEKPKDIWEEF